MERHPFSPAFLSGGHITLPEIRQKHRIGQILEVS
jgi:hypothetical protein